MLYCLTVTFSLLSRVSLLVSEDSLVLLSRCLPRQNHAAVSRRGHQDALALKNATSKAQEVRDELVHWIGVGKQKMADAEGITNSGNTFKLAEADGRFVAFFVFRTEWLNLRQCTEAPASA